MSSSNSLVKPEAVNVRSLRNETLVGLKCLRCETSYRLDDPRIDCGLGCRACLDEGFPVGLRCEYAPASTLTIDPEKTGMLRFASKLPFRDFPSLGEGGTALVSLPDLASRAGVEQVFLKNEGQNPTGSHKDRMSPLAVARAIDAGFSKVVCSSSGNAGASLASYAARAGVECCVIAATDISAPWAHAIGLTGCKLQIVADDQRWPLMEKMVREDGWFPVTNYFPTPIGSNPFGIEGYKTIAHELAEQLRQAPPTVVVVPTCRGDVLLGLWRGFVEAQEAGLIDSLPRLVAVEPGARLELVLSGSDYRSVFKVADNSMTSIDGGTVTYQSLKALQSTSGCAVSVGSSHVISDQRTLAEQGLHLELSSASSLAGLWQLAESARLQASDRAVLIGSSHGYKELPDAAATSSTRSCN